MITDSGLKTDPIYSLNVSCKTELNTVQSSHVAAGTSVYNSAKQKHDTRFASIDNKSVTIGDITQEAGE